MTAQLLCGSLATVEPYCVGVWLTQGKETCGRIPPHSTLCASVSSMGKKDGDSKKSHTISHRKQKLCRCCASLPYRGQRLIETALGGDGGDVHFDFDAGMYEIVVRMDAGGDDELKLDSERATRVAEKAERYRAKLRNQYSDMGLFRDNGNEQQQQRQERVRPLARFDLEELRLGAMMGTGGFSSVIEIEGFTDNKQQRRSEQVLRPKERMDRDFVRQHAQRQLDDSISAAARQATKKRRTTVSRFVIKCLRRGLLQDPDQFERAAMDLILETQLLMAMDHPNILAIRGMSREGPAGYRHGKYTSYFVIVDQLPETLDDRIWEWRSKLRKYKSRLSLPWQTQKYLAKKEDLLRVRVADCLSMAAGLQYMHSLRIINRDFKSSNVGFDIFGELKVFDFGLSRVLPPEEERVQRGFVMSRVGTKYYMAPEVALKQPYDVSADVYSFGVVLWEVLALSTPREAMRKCTHLLPDDDDDLCPLPMCLCWPESMTQLVRACLSELPEDRPTMPEVYERLEGILEGLGVEASGLPSGNSGEMRARRRSTVRINADAMKEAADMEATATAAQSES